MRSALAIAAVAAAALAGGLLALTTWTTSHQLDAGTVAISVSPFHAGRLDLYVPLVDWGVRFPGVRLPARLGLEVKSIDRDVVAHLAGGGRPAIEEVRAQAAGAIGDYIRQLVAVVAAAALALGAVVALAVRSERVVRLRWLLGAAGAVAVLWAVTIAVLLPPRGAIDHPDYYARGADIPVALRLVQDASASADALSEELDDQLLGLARLVQAPGRRTSLGGRPRLTIASDLHNNVLAIPTLQRAAARGPLLFAGDLTDRGSPVEAGAIRRVVGAGHPAVFVAGNHDSEPLMRSLARRGAIVLDQRGQLRPGRPRGPVIVRTGGLRIAGYRSPNERRARDGYADRGAVITREQQADFLGWLGTLRDRVDVVMVHEPALLEGALQVLRADPPAHPLLFVAGHTHRQSVDLADRVAVIDGGTIGAGGTGNLTDGSDLGLAVLTYDRAPFRPRAVDLVLIDPGDGSASARRVRLDQGPISAR